MGGLRLFQICYEGDLTAEVSHAVRRLGAQPNFDQSWQAWLPEGRHAAPLVRYLRSRVGDDARLLVACMQFSRTRDFLLIRHSLTPEADYGELHAAIDRLGTVIEIPFEATFVVDCHDPNDAHTLGRALGELCPDDSLMVTGISHDWAFCARGGSRMHLPPVGEAEMAFRRF